MMSMMVRPLLLSMLVACSLAAGCTGSGQPPVASTDGPALSLKTTPAALVDVPSAFEAGGIVRGHLVAEISSRVLAPITTIHVRPGDRVRAGQAVIDLEASQLEADRRRAAAALAAAEQGVSVAEADARGADAASGLARATRDRIGTLFDRRSATAQERDEAEASFAAAEARVAGARARTVEAASAVDAARAAAQAAAIAAAYAVVSAPFDGLVIERHADPGVMAAPGVPLLTIEAVSGLELDVRLDEARAASVSLGQTVRVAFDAQAGDDGAPAAGRVSEIGRLDPASHSFLVKVDLPGNAPVRSGMFGRATFEGPARRAIVIPASAVVRRGQMAFVFTLSDGRARLRAVSAGPVAASGVEIAAGVAPGEAVVTAPPNGLLDGTRVTASGAAR